MLENDGRGSFPEARSLEPARTTRYLPPLALDGDGLDELVMTHSRSGSISVVRNDGGSSCQEIRSFPLQVANCEIGPQVERKRWSNGDNRPINLPAGRHIVEVRREGYRTLTSEQTVTIRAGLQQQSERLVFQLQKEG